ncbi:MAG: hypothetical protein BWX71_02628 [Deltaproteobacteria bacterium ADurb.Bin072]|nr:MAG: hypothetical protein BWX71_02628 [Deltaproteobacteria bacterium ADurb.Bin072]
MSMEQCSSMTRSRRGPSGSSWMALLMRESEAFDLSPILYGKASDQ